MISSEAGLAPSGSPAAQTHRKSCTISPQGEGFKRTSAPGKAGALVIFSFASALFGAFRLRGLGLRCGIILYGTGDLAEKMGMKPVMTVKTTVSTIKDFDPDTSIGYGRRFFTTRPSRIAVLPIGYADGLFRALSGKLRVLTPYGEAQQVGRICMDMCMIDVTDLPQLKVGDEIEVFGEHELIETAAKQCGTISYELLCAVSKRVPRYYYLGGKCVDHNLQLLG